MKIIGIVVNKHIFGEKPFCCISISFCLTYCWLFCAHCDAKMILIIELDASFAELHCRGQNNTIHLLA